jgi:hypothetical protein
MQIGRAELNKDTPILIKEMGVKDFDTVLLPLVSVFKAMGYVKEEVTDKAIKDSIARTIVTGFCIGNPEKSKDYSIKAFQSFSSLGLLDKSILQDTNAQQREAFTGVLRGLLSFGAEQKAASSSKTVEQTPQQLPQPLQKAA